MKSKDRLWILIWPILALTVIGLLLLSIQTVSELLKQVRGILEAASGKKAGTDGKEAL